MNIIVSHPSRLIEAKIYLASSKSESNRALIINALTENKSDIKNASSARDTQTMMRLLSSSEKNLDVLDAGTTMRFLTAYLSLQNNERIITGTDRMCERPIGILVEALRTIGAEIEYLNREGYPPLLIKGIKEQKQHIIKIKGDVSSQYISALAMIAPKLPMGLVLELTGEIGSKPYIMMTLEMMASFGIKYSFEGNLISIPHQTYKPASFYVESDWSGASYWYSIAALSQRAQIELTGLKKDSLQGDAAIAKIMKSLGVTTEYKQNAIVLNKIVDFQPDEQIEIDFTDCPDIAQTVAVICAAKGVRLIMTGVESLKIKETDRLVALKMELAKFNVVLADLGNQKYQIYNPDLSFVVHKNTFINTYQDHRMAMAFAPLGLLGDITIEDKDVIVKSYPSYWSDLEIAGFTIKA